MVDQKLTTGVRIARLLKALDSSRRSASLYPDNHPRLEESLEDLKEQIAALSGEDESIKLTIYQQECFLDGEAPEEDVTIPLGFSERFLRLGLASVLFRNQPSTHELLGFLRLLSSDPRERANGHDLATLARSYGLENIQLEGLDYTKLFSRDIGLPAELGDRDTEQFARLLTLWDPHQDQRPMADDEIKALARLAEDQTALKKLMELSLKGPDRAEPGQAPMEGTAAALEGLAVRLKELLPEQWERVSQVLLRAALSLDSDLLRRTRPDLLQRRLAKPGEGLTVAQEMDEDELAVVIAEAMAAKEELDSALAAVIRDLVPKRSQRVALGPLITGELKALGVRGAERREAKTWWNEFVVEARGERDGTDAFMASLSMEPPVDERSAGDETTWIGAWFRTEYGESVLLSHYFDDLRGMLGHRNQPEDLQLVLGSYQREFQELATSGDLDMLHGAINELSGELSRCGKPVTETLRPILSVTFIEALAELAVHGDSMQRSRVMAIARFFGPSGSRVIMEAMSKTTHWETLEELRSEIVAYGPDVVDELLKWISHSDTRVAKEAVLMVRKVGDERVVSKIEPLLNHSDPDFRAAALSTLAKIGGPRRYNAIERGLSDQSPVVVDIALDAAGEFGPESFVRPLERLLLSHRQDTDFHKPRAKAIRLVGNHGLVELAGVLREIITGVESWIRFTRDQPLVLFAARVLLKLDRNTDRRFVQKRARWWRGRKVREACDQALREVEGRHGQ